MKYPDLPVYLILMLLTSCSRVPDWFGSEISISSDKPNIVLIVADDHGFGDAGCYGNDLIKTPNIDHLASEGILFTHGYCTSPSCSASRSVILTGLYNHANAHFGHQHSYHHFRAFEYLKSLPVYLEELADYKTVRIGKYHVGPEEVFRFRHVLRADGRNPVAMADSCKSFIESSENAPFFLYFCTNDPHRGGGKVASNPYRPDRFGNKDEGYPGVERAIPDPGNVKVAPFMPDLPETRSELVQYYESVNRVDQGVGRLMDHLKAAGIWDNTVVIYISDNGIAFPGAKTNIYEPGIRLPLIVKDLNGLGQGGVNSALINWADVTPTILDYAGILEEAKEALKKTLESSSYPNFSTGPIDNFHGHSIKAILHKPEPTDWQETYASHTFHEVTMYYPMRSIITKKYKLIWNIAHPLAYPHASDLWESATWQGALRSENKMYGLRSIEDYSYRPEFELYDLQSDPNEVANLADQVQHQEVLEAMKLRLRSFQERTNDPWLVKWEHE